MLIATGLSFTIAGHTILADVDLSVTPGTVLAVVGPNGAGKSTLLGLLAADLTPTAGAVRLDGHPLARLRPRQLARLRAVLPQQTHLEFAFTATEIVALGAHATGGDPAVIDAALHRVGCAHLAHRSFTTLSGGEQARVTLARVLAQQTRYLLLDEPTAHLDLKHQETVLGIARSLADEGRTIIAVLQDINLAARHADRIAIISAGRLAAHGPPSEVLTDTILSTVYQHPITVIDHPLHGGPLALPHRLTSLT
jgi:iron complex transport system ATP-binding protein